MRPAETPAADKVLRDFGYELLVRGKSNLAINVLEFGCSLRNLSSDQVRRMMIVNLANAHKLAGNAERSEAVLRAEDWSSSALEFRICIAAIRGDVEKAADLMKKLGRGKEIGLDGYQGWPAFYHVRDNPAFKEAIREIFGVEYVPSAKDKSSIDQVIEVLQGLQLAKGGRAIIGVIQMPVYFVLHF